jgi:hypothetical protein
MLFALCMVGEGVLVALWCLYMKRHEQEEQR